MAEEQIRVIERVIQPRSYTKKTVIVKKVCPVCGETFEGVRQKRYCRPACSARADYQRHAAQRRKNRIKRYREEKRRSVPCYTRLVQSE